MTCPLGMASSLAFSALLGLSSPIILVMVPLYSTSAGVPLESHQDPYLTVSQAIKQARAQGQAVPRGRLSGGRARPASASWRSQQRGTCSLIIDEDDNEER